MNLGSDYGPAAEQGGPMANLGVIDAVRRCVADSLAVDLAEVRLESRLVDDLGADSLDLVDIASAIERSLGVCIRNTAFRSLMQLEHAPAEVMEREYFSARAIEALRPCLPPLEKLDHAIRIKPRHLLAMITVQSICTVVQHDLEHPTD